MTRVSLRRVSFGILPVAAVTLLASAPSAQQRPLPNQEAFLQETRKHLQTDYTLQRNYSYVETRHEQKLDDQGKVTSESVKVIESYPGLPGEGRWERVISEDGKPTPAAKLEQQDRERQQKAQEYLKRQKAAQAQGTPKKDGQVTKARRDTNASVDDVFRVFDIKMQGRENIDGHDTILFVLTPRPNAEARTRDGSIMRHFGVRAWVSEDDYELVRLNAEAIETVPFGLGLVARMHKGARISFERRKVNEEVWLPSSVTYAGSARIGLIKVIRRGGVSEFSNYRKFTVDTSTTYSSPR